MSSVLFSLGCMCRSFYSPSNSAYVNTISIDNREIADFEPRSLSIRAMKCDTVLAYSTVITLVVGETTRMYLYLCVCLCLHIPAES